MRGAFTDGSKVAAARAASGLTQERLAAAADVDVKTVRKAERGGRLDLDTLDRLAAALGVGLVQLIRAKDDPPDSDSRVRAVRQWQRAWDAQDIDAVLAVFHPDAVMVLPGDQHLPFAGTHHGRDEIRRANEAAWAAVRTDPVPPEDFTILPSGDTVILHGVKGVCLPTGERVRMRSVHLFAFRGDLIAELRVEFDTLRFSRLLGAEVPGNVPGAARPAG